MPRAPLTAGQWAQARRLCVDLSLSNKEIAARLGVHTRTVEKRALREGWRSDRAGSKSVGDKPSFEALTLVARRSLIQRLYKTMDTKLKLMERRMERQMVDLDKDNTDLSAADHERDARAFGTMIKNIDQVKEMQADLDRVAGGQPATAADAELFAEADRFRREIAERLARFIPASR